MIDTQAIVWFGLDDPRLSANARRAMIDGAERLLVSAVTAYEFVDLNSRGRFGADLQLRTLLDMIEAEVVDYPAGCWTILDALPDLHRDPVDRMVVAHAIHADFRLISADKTIREYPVRSLW